MPVQKSGHWSSTFTKALLPKKHSPLLLCFPHAQSESDTQDFSLTGGGVIGVCLQPANNDKLKTKTINNIIAFLIFMLIPRVIIYKNGNLARLKKVMKTANLIN